jgi:predicted lipoprotein with Yx(FWY)xxD motif
MKRSLIAGGLVVVILAAVAVVAIADSGGGSSPASGSGGGGLYGSAPATARPAQPAAPSSSSDATIATADHGVGAMLVDGSGRTLYLWKADTSMMSTCSGACAQAWPPVTTGASVRPGKGVEPKLLGIAKRSDGTQQITYAGHPLYTFSGDSAAGQLNGQGSDAFGAAWQAVAPSGAAIGRNVS